MQQLRQDLRRVQNLCSSAERELRYEREKNIDLQKQNVLLQQECTKVQTEQGELFEVSITSFLQVVGGLRCWFQQIYSLLIYIWLHSTWGSQVCSVSASWEARCLQIKLRVCCTCSLYFSFILVHSLVILVPHSWSRHFRWHMFKHKLDFFFFWNSGQSWAEASPGKTHGHNWNMFLSLSTVAKKPAEGQRTGTRALKVLPSW